MHAALYINEHKNLRDYGNALPIIKINGFSLIDIIFIFSHSS